jgi:hypothetical protein
MIVYEATKSEFLEDVFNDELGTIYAITTTPKSAKSTNVRSALGIIRCSTCTVF